MHRRSQRDNQLGAQWQRAFSGIGRPFALAAIVILALSAGLLLQEVLRLRGELGALRDTVALLEQEKRELESRPAAGAAPKPEEIIDVRQQVEEETSRLRGLAFQHPVTYKLIERGDFRGILTRLIDTEYPPARLRDYARSLAAFGLVPEGADLRQIWLSMYDEQVGAFFVPEEHALYTFRDLSFSSGLDRMMLSHELTHALQDQNFGLEKLALRDKDNDDRALAAAALIEGDATVLMTQYYAAAAGSSSLLGDLGAMLRQRTTRLQSAPAYLRGLMLFPYTEGQKFALALQMRGGTAELDRAYRDPPVSSEQILHPDKFMKKRDEPTPVELKRVDLPGWRVIGRNCLGEFGIRLLLESEMTAVEAALAAEGWDGDAYEVSEAGERGPTALRWRTVWDTEDDAIEFEQAYNRLVQKRRVIARVKCEGIYVTVTQSTDNTFFDALKKAGVGK